MHILTDTNIGGVGVLLLNQLKHFDRTKFDISVVLPRGSELVPRVGALGYPVIETKRGADRSFEPAAISEYYSLIRSAMPGIVHCHGALSARVAAHFCRVPVRIYTRHCAFRPSLPRRSFPIKQLSGALNGALSTAIVAVADAAASDLIETGIRRDKITVIINGVEPLREIDDDERLRTRLKLGFSEHDFVAGIFARLEECKGHIYLLRALAIAADRGEVRLRLLICGKGSLEDELRRRAVELGIADRVAFTGFVEDVAPYMSAVDVNVNCSVGTETSSLALSEGMSLGKAAVVSDYGGNPNMVDDGISGIVYPAADAAALARALMLLESDRELLTRMSKRARLRYAEKFTAAAMTRKLEELYVGQAELRLKNRVRKPSKY